MKDNMRQNWQVKINNDGTLYIRGKEKEAVVQNLFGAAEFEFGICIYRHHLRSLRQLLNKLFPQAPITSLDSMEEIIREEFCRHRSVSDLRNCLDTARIPYRAYSKVA